MTYYRRAAIRAIRSHVPARHLTNAELAREFPEWDVTKIFEKTGIATRGIAEHNECASDLACIAAEKLFSNAIVDRQDIDFLLFCTQSPDYFLPATACLLQDRLKLSRSVGAVDINQGCSGFVYGLSLAKGLIESETARNVLLATADTYSKFLARHDRGVRTIFGDGAAVTWISAIDVLADETPIGPFVLGTDGRGAENLIVRAGALRAIEQTADDSAHVYRPTLFMNGPEIFTFTLSEVPRAIHRLLEKASLRLEMIDYFVFHQANRFMLEQLKRKLGIPSEKFALHLEDTGNTVSSTIPMALEAAATRGSLPSDATIMLVGFGVGYSWGACIIRVPGGLR